MKYLFTFVLAVASILVSTTETADIKAKEYPLTTVVTEINENEIVVTDFNGNDWVFENTNEDWCIGDYCSMIMSDNATEIIFDDEIISCRYSGYLQGKWNDVIERR